MTEAIVGQTLTVSQAGRLRNWVKEMRSGSFKFVRGTLRSITKTGPTGEGQKPKCTTGYCALGVLAQIEMPMAWDEAGRHGGKSGATGQAVNDIVGMTGHDADRVASANDGQGDGFEGPCRYIEDTILTREIVE